MELERFLSNHIYENLITEQIQYAERTLRICVKHFRQELYGHDTFRFPVRKLFIAPNKMKVDNRRKIGKSRHQMRKIDVL